MSTTVRVVLPAAISGIVAALILAVSRAIGETMVVFIAGGAADTMGAEQFGTNLRATAATTIPNMVRGSLPLINLLFVNVFQKNLGWSLVKSGIVTGCIVMVVTLVAAYFTEETFHKDLNYVEGEGTLP